MNEELKNLIDKHIEEGTFSATAAEGIVALRKDLEAAHAKIEGLEEQLEEGRKNNRTLQADITRLQDKNTTLTDELSQAVSDIEGMKERDRQAIAEVARGQAYKHAMEIVFRPAQLRRTVQSGQHMHFTQQYDASGRSVEVPLDGGSHVETHPED